MDTEQALASTLAGLESRLRALERRRPLSPLVAYVDGTFTNVAYNGNAGALITAFTLPSFTAVDGHRYVIEWAWRAATTATYWTVRQGGIMVVDFYAGYPPSISAYQGDFASAALGASLSGAQGWDLQVRSQNATAGAIWTDGGGWAGVFDYGPV